MTEYLKNTELWGNPLSEYLLSLLMVCGALAAGALMIWLGRHFIKKRVEATPARWDDILYNIFQWPFVLGLVLLVLWFAFARLHFPETVEEYLHKGYRFILVMDITWILVNFCQSLCDHFIMPRAVKGIYGRLDENVARTLKKATSAALWLVGLLAAIESVGINIAALITTLGIGGVAVALASQETLKNIIGGITIFMDRPFRLGDRIRVGTHDGYVEDLGMRSTRLRTLDGFLVSIPNYQVVESAVENITLIPSRRIKQFITLPYNTPQEKVQEAIKVLEDTPKHVDIIKQNEIYVSLTSFSERGYTFTLIYYMNRTEDYFVTQNAVDMYIMREFVARGIHFAVPVHRIAETSENDIYDSKNPS